MISTEPTPARVLTVAASVAALAVCAAWYMHDPAAGPWLSAVAAAACLAILIAFWTPAP